MVSPARGHPPLCCPFCRAYEVERMFVASTRLDACQCRACGAGWDEELAFRRARARA